MVNECKHQKFKCDRCNRNLNAKSIISYKKNWYCKKCYNFLTTTIPGNEKRHKKCVPIEIAVQKVRNVLTRAYIKKSNNRVVAYYMISIPSCYEGKKVRVILAEDKNA